MFNIQGQVRVRPISLQEGDPLWKGAEAEAEAEAASAAKEDQDDLSCSPTRWP